MNVKKVIFYLFMLALLIIWGAEYVVVKLCMTKVTPIELIFCRYAFGAIFIFIIKMIKDRKFPIRKKDIPIIIICSLTGEFLYFFAEYNAMNYLNISTITIFLALVPIISMIIELIFFKKTPSLLMVIMSIVCIIGVAVFVGGELNTIFSGSLMGFVLIFIAIISWNCYNFLTERLTGNYKPLDLTFFQLLCTSLLSAPFVIFKKTDYSIFLDKRVILGILFLVIFSSIVGFVVYIHALEVLGATSCAMFSNFLPISASFFGFVILKEELTLLQVFAGIVVIIAGLLFITGKANLNKREKLR
ncbi:MAG: DMT family transporter [Clostridiales Family XIII bacterium]|jgi:drug/metabolite transporter (DMT)-like permease|nr:DMT family transporter [Clostridiales Family XIII bacterium]